MVLGEVVRSLERRLGNEKIIDKELPSDIDRDDLGRRDQIRRDDRVLLDRRRKVSKTWRPFARKHDAVVEGFAGVGGFDSGSDE